jgi:hypothetical protein
MEDIKNTLKHYLHLHIFHTVCRQLVPNKQNSREKILSKLGCTVVGLERWRPDSELLELMSLLRACTALARPRSSLLHRTFSTEPITPAPTTAKEPSEIAPIPQKDVLSADIISGAPGTVQTSEQYSSGILTAHNPQPSSAIALSVYINRPATLCRAVEPRGCVGASTGIFCLAVGVGRTR